MKGAKKILNLTSMKAIGYQPMGIYDDAYLKRIEKNA